MLQALGDVCGNKNADLDGVLRQILDTAIALTGADKGNVQLIDLNGETLRLAAHRGFDAPFLTFFATVDAGDPAACGAAMRSRVRIIIDDVTKSDLFAGQPSRDILLDAGVRAVQSTPLVSSAGTLLGMVSTHFASPRGLGERESRWIDLLARQAADFLERKQTEQQLTRANAALREADQRKDEFLALLGHELRNPMSAVASAVGVLNIIGKPDDVAQRARAVIGRQVQHLSRLVDDLLDASRITTGKIILNRQPMDLSEAARDVMSVMRAAGRFDRHDLKSDLSPVWVDADGIRIAQVLSNLIENALKYTPTGGHIAVSVRVDGRLARIEVSDSGMGIEPTVIDKIFTMFVQGEQTPERGRGGLGLGLTLVKRLVEMHGGTIQARSDGRGKGATFVIRLPIIRAQVRPTPDTSTTAATTSRRCILIVEDNDDAREMVRTALVLAGHEVYEASDGPSGLEALQSLRPDVALIDLGLPGIDGYEVARKARELVGRAVRLVAVTGYGRVEDRARASAAGFDAHVVKPIDVVALTQVLSVTSSPAPARPD